jgi:hypothetical protein
MRQWWWKVEGTVLQSEVTYQGSALVASLWYGMVSKKLIAFLIAAKVLASL